MTPSPSFYWMLALGFCLSTFSCQQNAPAEVTTEPATQEVETTSETVAQSSVLTQEEQANLTPDEVWAMLAKGNERFVSNDLTKRNHSDQVRQSADAQYPKAIVLSCVDSRVPVEDVFDRGIGDIFVARVAGNIINEDILGSMEYACKVAGSKLIVVLGHEHCGAVHSAVKGVELGNITPLLQKIEPAIAATAGERNADDGAYVHNVSESNIRHSIQEIRTNSAILQQMETDGAINIVGAMYDMHTGKVSVIE